VADLVVASVPVSGTWLRHTPVDSDPLYRPPTPADGRWQGGTVIEGAYLAAEEATVWAEWYRWLAEHEIEPLHSLPRELWRYRVSLRNVADLTGNGVLADLGLPDAVPGRDSGLCSNRSASGFMPRDLTVSCIARRRDHKAYACASFDPSPQTFSPGWSRLRLRAGSSSLPHHLAACARRLRPEPLLAVPRGPVAPHHGGERVQVEGGGLISGCDSCHDDPSFLLRDFEMNRKAL
jgi:hypothetical protein